MPFTRHQVASRLGVAAFAALASLASAQQIYRIVGPDGRVTFSDKPPPDPSRAAPAKVVPLAGGSPASPLPYELQQVASRYPVTLYTSANCGPCETGRTFLASRGVPFDEKTVSSNEDYAALQRLSGGAALPFLTIGAQQLRGYSEVEWSQFLDAAGYPKTSALPANYRRPQPTPLVAVQEPQPRRTERPAAAQLPAPPAGPNPGNPAGIQF